MSYSSDRVDPRDVAVYRRMLDQLMVRGFPPEHQLAIAQALEDKALEIRQRVANVPKASD